MFKVTELGTWMQCATHYPAIKNFLLRNIPQHYMDIHKSNEEYAEKRVKKRVASGATRHDLIEGLLLKQTELELPLRDIVAHANLLTIAGSETTATLLSGVTFLLAANPEKLARVTDEVRGAFGSEEEITIAAVGRLTYMLACLDEALRMYPPVPTGLPRVVPRGGKTFVGKFVPEGVSGIPFFSPSSSCWRAMGCRDRLETRLLTGGNENKKQTHVGIWQWAASRYSANWVEPFGYHPERFLAGNDQFAADKKEAMQPFSFGPRNCIGRNLAYAEMRTILARVLFNFDVKLALPEMEDWMARQKVFNLWAKPPLMVHLTPMV